MTGPPYAEGRRRTYGDIEGVQGLDLTVAAGETFGFPGPDGARQVHHHLGRQGHHLGCGAPYVVVAEAEREQSLCGQSGQRGGGEGLPEVLQVDVDRVLVRAEVGDHHRTVPAQDVDHLADVFGVPVLLEALKLWKSETLIASTKYWNIERPAPMSGSSSSYEAVQPFQLSPIRAFGACR
ncbi:hypothetical protein [Micromonospora carbonacea]|uniref:hypothetical protein n=1 Tax=Micromonospora carbonacea TaxID=47853 RepID=UPI0009452008|nr:hypothetical protein [Micromonospora carbonacea]